MENRNAKDPRGNSGGRSPGGSNNGNGTGGDPTFNWRGLVLMTTLLAVLAVGFAVKGTALNAPKDIPYSEFLERLDKRQMVEDVKHPLELVIEEGSSTQTLRGLYSEASPPKVEGAVPFRTTVSVDFDRYLFDKIKGAGLTPNVRRESNVVGSIIFSFVPVLMLLLLI